MQRGARIGHGHNMDLDHFILVMFIHVIKGQIESRRVFFVIQNTFKFQSCSRGLNIWYFHLFWYFTVSAWLFSRQQIKYGSYFFRYLYDITTWDDDMTWRCHETCSGHSGVMSRAAWQHRDTTWRDCNKCSQCHCLAIVQLPLSAILEFTQHDENFSRKVMDWFILCCSQYQVWCPGQITSDGCAMVAKDTLRGYLNCYWNWQDVELRCKHGSCFLLSTQQRQSLLWSWYLISLICCSS